jgi:hypothetical protein
MIDNGAEAPVTRCVRRMLGGGRFAPGGGELANIRLPDDLGRICDGSEEKRRPTACR